MRLAAVFMMRTSTRWSAEVWQPRMLRKTRKVKRTAKNIKLVTPSQNLLTKRKNVMNRKKTGMKNFERRNLQTRKSQKKRQSGSGPLFERKQRELLHLSSRSIANSLAFF